MNECFVKRVNILNAPILVYLKEQHAEVISKQYLGSIEKRKEILETLTRLTSDSIDF